MEFRTHGDGDNRVAELLGQGILISATGDALDLIANAESRRIIVDASQFHPDFLKLGTGLAGEILQKVTNYHIRLVIVGDFSSVQSPPLRDFIRESNRGGQVNFVASLEDALSALRKESGLVS